MKIAVALSGGVDSAASALLLMREGYEVIGVTYRLLPSKTTDIEDAKKVCQFLGIEHHVFEYADIFKEKVIDPFIDSYLNAKTPNPCIFCNKAIKFGRFLDDAKALGCDLIATGHYADILKDEEGCHILKGENDAKDQSYVLYNLTQDIMKHVIFPLGKWSHTKDELREMLKKEGIPVAQRPDSQDICFIPSGKYAEFIEERRPDIKIKGNFIDEDGKILGPHKGFYRYTKGQRKGLGIALGAPAFVTGINPATGDVTLSLNEEKLLSDELIVKDFNFCAGETEFPLKCSVKMRYKSPLKGCIVTKISDNLLNVKLESGGRAPTEGQSAVFYKGREVLGGGIIEKVL